MIKWFLGTFLGIFLGIAGYFYWYLGAWKTVTISEKKMGPFFLLAKNHTGAYHKIAPVIQQVEDWAKAQNLPCEKTFGEYLDDPQTVDQGRLKSRGGCIFTTKPNLSSQMILPEDMQFYEVAEKQYVVALFDGSPAIGPLKVYPKVMDYFAALNKKIESSVIEIYEVHSPSSMSTTYLFVR